jgi:murein DD-endopeptidase MepM/ murein hydrolase activator NlpD
VSLSTAVARVQELEARAAALRAAAERLSAPAATAPPPRAAASPAAPTSFANVLAAIAPDVTPLEMTSPLPRTPAPAVTAAPAPATAFEQRPASVALPAAPAVDVADAPAEQAGYAYPLAVRGELLGLPYQGSHKLFDNWESDNAVDLAVPAGTPVYAVADGTIGSQIGALDSNDPHLEGLRLHLVTDGNEFYYAHLSQIVVQPGQEVQKGQLLGYSGEANGVAHLHFAALAGTPVDVVG